MNNSDYLDKVYAGILGKCIGVRLGAPVEPSVWSYERILSVYGEIDGYVKEYRNFAADDDVNGPLFFIRALLDHAPPLTSEKIGRTWLNYTREEKGFYWWGGKGVSTEHTAYLNLKNGIPAPMSGSAGVNGKVLSEQIGGQIFIDSWGLVFPENPEKAAEYASMAARVSHDGNGVYGAVFIAAAISEAFSNSNIFDIVENALSMIPVQSEYYRVVTAVRDFYLENPHNWRDALKYLHRYFGYDRYPGVCHIIPNSGVVALSLYYGKGDFARTLEIAVMSGWDTDCNAGNAGTILGVMNGPGGIPLKYRSPVNDFHAASSIAGALNIIDIPTVSREIAVLGLRQRGSDIPESWNKGIFSNDIYLNFMLPGSTSGIRTSNRYLTPVLKNNGRGGLTVVLDRLKQNESVRIFYKPYYRREDFDDERYSPTFTPLAYSGQTLGIRGKIFKWDGEEILIKPYVRDSGSKNIFCGPALRYDSDGDLNMKWNMPEVPFAIDEAGFVVLQESEGRYLGRIDLYGFEISGPVSASVYFRDEAEEFGGLSRCSVTGGKWKLEDDFLYAATEDLFLLYTGPYYSRNYTAEVRLKPVSGESHLLVFRSIGAERGYFFGFTGENTVSLIKKDHETEILESAEFRWEKGRIYSLTVEVHEGDISCFVDNSKVIGFNDSSCFPYGMAGAAKLGKGETAFYFLGIQEKSADV